MPGANLHQISLPSCHVVIVNYNAGSWLARAVKSVMASDVGSLQCTVVDNASQDQSMVLAQKQLPQQNNDGVNINWVFNQQNLGFAAANNQVLAKLEADYAVLLNPDCELDTGTLRAMLLAMQQNSEFGLASCRILNEDLSLQATCRRRFPTPWSALVRLLMLNKLFPNSRLFADFDYGDDEGPQAQPYTVEAISGAFMVVRRTALEQVGLLDEGYFMHCEDLDWCKRFALAGWQVGFVPMTKIIHAKGVSSKSRPIRVLWTLHKGMNRFFDKFYKDAYSLPMRATVKLGIYLSFLARAGLSLIRTVLVR